MTTPWEDRLRQIVFPAILDGAFIYTAEGELCPGPGVKGQDQYIGKPTGLPLWQVYLEAKKSGQPGIRFIQLVHRVHNIFGSPWQSYRHTRSAELGVPLTLPLGEGMETPEMELHLHRELLGKILFKTVRVIGLGRTRFLHDRSAQPFIEPVLMEVYGKDGSLLWVNPIPGCSLEQAIADNRLTQNGSGGRAGERIPLEASEALVEATFRRLIARGLKEEEIEAQVSTMFGIGLSSIHHRLKDFKERNGLPMETLAQIRQTAVQAEKYYSGEELIEIVADLTHQAPEVVRRVLQTA